MMGTPTTTVRFENEDNYGSRFQAETTPELSEFLSDLTEGDYVTVVYPTPSNGGSLHRAGGTVENIRTLDGTVDDFHFQIEDCDRDGHGDTGYLHVSASTGSYYFSDGEDSPADGWEVERVAWTPEQE